MPETTSDVGERRFSRRSFLAFLAAGATAFGLLLLRNIDVAEEILYFFGLSPDHHGFISYELRSLHDKDLVLFRRTTIFFSLHRVKLKHLAHWFQQPVLVYWSVRLFANRSLAWAYINYPAVDESSICSGLIRKDT